MCIAPIESESIGRWYRSMCLAGICGMNRDSRCGLCALPSRLAERTMWRLTKPVGPFVVGGRTVLAAPGLSIAHVPRTRRRCPPASETARQRPSASRLSRPPDYLGRHPSRCAPFRPVGVVLLHCAPKEPVTASEAAAIVMAQCQESDGDCGHC